MRSERSGKLRGIIGHLVTDADKEWLASCVNDDMEGSWMILGGR